MFKARVKNVYDRCEQRSSKPLYNNKVEIAIYNKVNPRS